MKTTTMIARSGRLLDLLRPDPAQIYLPDIAHALGALCRYGGHTPRHYSVAEHSIWVSYAVPPEARIHALMHDAHEAYLGDWISPVESTLRWRALYGHTKLRETQRVFDRLIYRAIGIDQPSYAGPTMADVLVADLAVGAAERLAFWPGVAWSDAETAWDWQAAGFRAFPSFQPAPVAADAWLTAVEQALSRLKGGE